MFKLVVLVASLAVASATPSLLAPGLWGAGLHGHGLLAPGIGPYGLGLAGLVPHSAIAPQVIGGSLAPGQPANVIGPDGRPLDTLDVNLARAQHLSARIVDGSRLHLLKKRSLIAAPVAVSHTSRIDLPGRIIASPYAAHVGLAAPWGLAAPHGLAVPHGLATPLGLGWGAPLGLAGHLGHGHLW